MHLTPYLVLVLAGFGTFMAVLGYVWLRSVLDTGPARRPDAGVAEPLAGEARRTEPRRAA